MVIASVTGALIRTHVRYDLCVPRSRRWTDEQLAEAVAASRTLSEVCQRLGLTPGKYDRFRQHIARLGLDATHIPGAGAGSPQRRRTWSTEDLARAVAASHSVSEVSRRLGYTPNGGVHRMVVGHIRTAGLDTAHFTGQAWSRGRRVRSSRTTALEELLVKGSVTTSSKLRARLIAAGLKPSHCEECGVSEWRGKQLPLHLDHINGDHTDNRIENLRILCPNCHAVTETWCRRSSTPA